MIANETIERVAFDLMCRAAIDIPDDYLRGIKKMAASEREGLCCFVLDSMVENYAVASADRRPMCADTGLPRYYVKVGNEARIEGGFVGIERALRSATAQATFEEELKEMGNGIGMGAMGFVGSSMVVDCHIEVGHTHTGGMPMSVHSFCLSSRRATARVDDRGVVEERPDPCWFTPYMRRETVEWPSETALRDIA